jgi:L-threonylcarbamoyladenylate synthase
VYLDGGEVTGGQPSTIVDITGDSPRVVRVGALSLEQLRAVVPEVASDADEPAATEQPVADEPASDRTATDRTATDEPASGETASVEPTSEERTTDEPVEASKEDEPKTDPDVRPAD